VDRMAAVDKSQSGIGIGNTRVPGLYDVEYDRKRSTKNLVQIREGPAMERKRLENLERESKIQELQKSHDNLNAMKLEKKSQKLQEMEKEKSRAISEEEVQEKIRLQKLKERLANYDKIGKDEKPKKNGKKLFESNHNRGEQAKQILSN